VVYKARDRDLNDLVALKTLHKEIVGDTDALERLKAELRLARKITHKNVLRTYDFGELDGVPFISMEYVRGVTLRYLLDEAGRVPFAAGLRLAKQLGAGLEAAHAMGVLHRDIKPENLILQPTGDAKLMDFGISRPLRSKPAEAGDPMWGTPRYMAPEQLEGRDPDARADIYACGVILYEVFTGRMPYSATHAAALFYQQVNEEPDPPRTHVPEIPEVLERIIMRCLSRTPDRRYRTADLLVEALEACSA
jgi:serine/threonine-protein kinase